MKLLTIVLLIISSFYSSFANSNGIWTYPEDIKGGVFGEDESLTLSDNYTLNNIVYFNRDLISNSALVVRSIKDHINPLYTITPSGTSFFNRIDA